MSSSPSPLHEQFAAHSQDHVFAFWDTLTESEQTALTAELSSLDLASLAKAHERAVAAVETTVGGEITPLERMVNEDAASEDGRMDGWMDMGLQAVAAGKVAAVLLAGGQGTRLGSKDPKGCYVIGSPSGMSLFEMQAKRIARVQAMAGADAPPLPWYIMTSGPTHGPTVAFFEENAFFGLSQDQIMFFQQGTLPCLTPEGKLILKTKSSLARAPDGNGGIYDALKNEGVLADMASRGIEAVHVYCVDNCLAKVADPAFVGYCLDAGVKCGVKVIKKIDPSEKVGVLAKKDNLVHVLEYSELPTHLAEETNDDGSLVYSAANIVNHFYTLDFLNEIVQDHVPALVHHVARKKIPHVSQDGQDTITPDAINGIKLELFIFDVFPAAQDSIAVLQGDRSRDFAPLKNAPGTGKDCPETSVVALSSLHKSWASKAGLTLNGEPDLPFEVSPLVSYAGEGLESLSTQEFTLPAFVQE